MDPYTMPSFLGAYDACLQTWDPASSQLGQTTGRSSWVVPNQTKGSTDQTSQPPNTDQEKKQMERAQRKREIDKASRQRCKIRKVQMQSNLDNLTGENESLKNENLSLRKDNASINQTLRDQEKEIDRLRSYLLQLKQEHEKQNVLLQTLSGLPPVPVQLENERLKDENASLRKNACLNSMIPQLAEENAKLKIENKVLKVQNVALCGKIVSGIDKKCEQEL